MEVSHGINRCCRSRNLNSFIGMTLTHILTADGGNMLFIPTEPFGGPLSSTFSTIILNIREIKDVRRCHQGLSRLHACPTELGLRHLWFQFSLSLWQKLTSSWIKQDGETAGTWSVQDNVKDQGMKGKKRRNMNVWLISVTQAQN